MKNPMNLKDKRIILTGASSGIGKAAAVKLDELGASLVMIARNYDKLNETLSLLSGTDHKIYSYDLKKIEGIEDFINNVVKENGKFDGFVHCAGVAPMRPVKSAGYGFIHDIMLINFYAFAELVKSLSKANCSNDGASIVAVSSVSSLKGNKAQGAYSASKSALNGLISPMAKELWAREIRVNSILFGMVKTEMFADFIKNGGDISAWKDQYAGIGEPEDAANVIAFLLSSASRMITGSNLVADNGYLS
jgi:NAD(P)-dependent dehydrogenase (short-subunit alcohol dehydrogenase family)